MRRPRAKTVRLAAVIAASAATAACGISNAATTTDSLTGGPTGTPVTIGISLPLGGGNADGFAADGAACLKGYQLWASDVNSHGGLKGHPVQLKIVDDKGDPGRTEANYKTLITQDHVDLILAPFSSLLTVAAEDATKPLHYVLAAGSAGGPTVYQQGDPLMFSTNVPVTFQFAPFIKWVETLPGHPTTAAYPMVSDPFADPPILETRQAFDAHGIKDVFPPPDKGNGWNAPSTHQLQIYARQVANKDPGIVVLGSVDPPTVEAFAGVFRTMHYTPKIFIAAAGPDQGQAFLDKVGTGNALGFMVPNGWNGAFSNALSHVMVQSYIAKYGGTASDINADVAESYSAGETLAAGVTGAAAIAANGSVDQQAVANWLHKNTVQTVLGPAAFNNTGENTLAPKLAVIFQWQQSAGGAGAPQFVQVLGSFGHNVNPVFPKPAWSGG